MTGPATAHDIVRKIVSIISWTLLVCAACFGQTPLHQLVAGQSTRTDVERVAGKPVAVYSQTLVEYHPQESDSKTWQNVAKMYVQYRTDSPVVERIELLLVQPISRSDAFKNLDVSAAAAREPHLPDQPAARGQNEGRLVEYFGAPFYVVLTYQSADENSGVARVARYSPQLFQSALSSLNSNAGSNTPSNASANVPPGAPTSGQVEFSGILPGTSTINDVNKILGQPVAQSSPTAFQYGPKSDTGRIDVEYRPDSAIVDHIEVRFPAPIERAALAKQLHLPSQADAKKNSNDGKLVEYFGEPSFVSMTFATGEESSGVASLGCYSREMFTRLIPLTKPTLSSKDPSAPPLIPSNTDFTVRLLSPLNTLTSKKGDKVTVQVIEPQSFNGDILEGTVRQAKSGGKINGKSVLNFSFDTLNHGNQPWPVQATVKSLTNSKGQPNVDEEGQIVKKKNNLGKIAAGTAVGALIGGLAGGGKGAAIGAGVGAGASLVLVEMAAEGANVSFAPGSEFVLSVKSQNR